MIIKLRLKLNFKFIFSFYLFSFIFLISSCAHKNEQQILKPVDTDPLVFNPQIKLTPIKMLNNYKFYDSTKSPIDFLKEKNKLMTRLQKVKNQKDINSQNEELFNIYHELALLHQFNGMDFLALNYYEKALMLDSFNIGLRVNLAYFYLKISRFKEACQTFHLLNEKIEKSSMDFDIAKGQAYCLLSDGKFLSAQKIYENFPREKFNDPELIINVALTTKLLGNIEKAQAILKTLSEPNDKNLTWYPYYFQVKNFIEDDSNVSIDLDNDLKK
jgi:tetratricopeptide (TPR) repeat protein